MADIYTGLLAYTAPTVNQVPTVGLAEGFVQNYFQHMAAKCAKALTSANTAADEVTVHATHLTTTSGGNYTITVNCPTLNGGTVFTTANLAYDDTDATIEAAIDTASPATVGDGDVNCVESGSAGLSDGNLTITCNGNLASMPVIITSTDVDLSGSGHGLGAITRSTPGCRNRYAVQALAELQIVTAASATYNAGEEPTLVDNTANAVGWVDRPELRVVKWLGKAISTYEEGTPYVNDQLETLFPEIVQIR